MVTRRVDGERSLSRTIILVTFVVLSIGFGLGCWKRMSWELLLAYPTGVMITFIPRVVIKFVMELKPLIQAWRGNGNDTGIGN